MFDSDMNHPYVELIPAEKGFRLSLDTGYKSYARSVSTITLWILRIVPSPSNQVSSHQVSSHQVVTK